MAKGPATQASQAPGSAGLRTEEGGAQPFSAIGSMPSGAVSSQRRSSSNSPGTHSAVVVQNHRPRPTASPASQGRPRSSRAPAARGKTRLSAWFPQPVSPSSRKAGGAPSSSSTQHTAAQGERTQAKAAPAPTAPMCRVAGTSFQTRTVGPKRLKRGRAATASAVQPPHQAR